MLETRAAVKDTEGSSCFAGMRAEELLRNRNGPCVRGKRLQLDVRLEEKTFPSSHLIALQSGGTALLHRHFGISFKKRKETVPFGDGKQLLGNCRVVASDVPPLGSCLTWLCAGSALCGDCAPQHLLAGPEEQTGSEQGPAQGSAPGSRQGHVKAQVRALCWPREALAAHPLGLCSQVWCCTGSL